jgi:hypothetical protein
MIEGGAGGHENPAPKIPVSASAETAAMPIWVFLAVRLPRTMSSVNYVPSALPRPYVRLNDSLRIVAVVDVNGLYRGYARHASFV